MFVDPSSMGALKIKNLKQEIVNNNGAGITEAELDEIFANYNDSDQINVKEFIKALYKAKN